MARKWQKLAADSRRRISWQRTKVANKGHFVIYTTDGRRFMIPLTYLKSEILTELFRMAEEEFGLSSDGPITLPCDSIFMEHAISILQRQGNEDLEKALILSLVSYHSSLSLSDLKQENTKQQLLICSF
ncbi:auxin-responsive protein SAUR67-like [Chenopodium quinoa]|nr:auxin-responsive protein SAUR67-like [Chenopodium quinoa]